MIGYNLLLLQLNNSLTLLYPLSKMDTCIDYDRMLTNKILEERRIKKANNRGADLGLKNNRTKHINLLSSKLYKKQNEKINPKRKVVTKRKRKKPKQKVVVVVKPQVVKKKKKGIWKKLMSLFVCGGSSLDEEEVVVETQPIPIRRRKPRKTKPKPQPQPQPIHRETMKNMRYGMMMDRMNFKN